MFINKQRTTMRNLVITMILIFQISFIYCESRPSFVSDDMIAAAASVVNACQTQTGVATADIEAVRNGDWPDSEPLKCYMNCMMESFALIDDRKEISLNGMLSFFQRIPAYREEVEKTVRKCKYIANGDNCQYAYTFNLCYAKSSPKTYYLF
ncbi:pheromone-binding protein-related protein 6-like isoform X2 [Aphidius gifuensis]|uniref:pheromone-binding protein-related protein 6-like isoform X2 n=1 Tax=Aphidius gifuensis TaxID=684658 RepID=UPI001CDC110F|nr:pheromone-binding protein-related protein 6-like isoform X2 [Aphidius gifuensis]